MEYDNDLLPLYETKAVLQVERNRRVLLAICQENDAIVQEGVYSLSQSSDTISLKREDCSFHCEFVLGRDQGVRRFNFDRTRVCVVNCDTATALRTAIELYPSKGGCAQFCERAPRWWGLHDGRVCSRRRFVQADADVTCATLEQATVLSSTRGRSSVHGDHLVPHGLFLQVYTSVAGEHNLERYAQYGLINGGAITYRRKV